MDRKSTRREFLPGRVAVLGLGLMVMSFTGCGGETAVTQPSKTVSATDSTPAPKKKAARKSRLESPNADLSARERRALKAKGQLPE